MPLAVMAISCGVLAQRRQENAVGKGEAAQLQGLEQLRDWLAILADESCPRGRRLERSKVRNLVKCSASVLHIQIVMSIMAYGRRGTVDVTRFSNDVLDNVMVRDGFRHDVRFTGECMRLEPLLWWGVKQIYTANTC
jgi:hypothetical protein